jgi:putative membrane protein
MKIENVFSKEDLAKIEDAVTRAETRAPGEIVPYIVGRSDSYPEALWRGAAVGGAVGAVVWALLSFGEWAIDPTLPALYTWGRRRGTALARLAPIRRRLAGRRSLERRVEQRARRVPSSGEISRRRGAGVSSRSCRFSNVTPSCSPMTESRFDRTARRGPT